MKEIKAIIEAYNQIDTSQTKAALATVVRVEGSSYRRTGARMLVMDNGFWVGGISGGCLEGDALKRAKFAIAKAAASKITYDTTDDSDEHQIGVGLGCNGIIDVLFTPLNFTDDNNPVEVLKTCISQNRQTHVLLTITGLKGNWNTISLGQLIHYQDVSSLAILQEATLIQEIEEKITIQKAKGSSCPYTFEVSENQQINIFIEILPPEIHVVLIGHQYDVFPLTRLLKELGWRVSVVANPLKINAKIIKIADAIIPTEDFSNLLIDSFTAIVLMSHDYKTDKQNLPKVLQTPAAYIGMLGPKVRSEKIFRELAEEGQAISAENRTRIFAPVGLDIGAVTPEEIALSLAAEIKTVLANRSGGHLKFRQSPIHERDK